MGGIPSMGNKINNGRQTPPLYFVKVKGAFKKFAIGDNAILSKTEYKLYKEKVKVIKIIEDFNVGIIR